MTTYAELQSQAEASRRRIGALDRPRLAVGIDTSSIAVGALETLAALAEAVASKGIDVVVDRVGGNGLSFANPVVELTDGDTRILYQHVSAADAVEFVDTVLGRKELDNRWLLGAIEGGPHLQRMDDYEWWSVQKRRLMQDMGYIDPEEIDEAIACGAYSGLERALGMTPEEVIAEVTGSKLGGRSGGFFPTGRKWDFLRTSPTTPKAMVCNADEGDPGAWVNRMTMENDPHALLEGMIVGGWACGAARGYIYIREEYPLAFERIIRAVEQARERGVLGENVLGRDFSFDIDVVRGAGSYVCGEESGLIASIEDARGMPKIRPPFPAMSGVFGQGSNVNNVGSYHCAAWIIRYGVESYADVGTERNPGTMLFSLSGHVQRVGCFELAFGTTVRTAFEVCGGGAPDGHSFKALQPGGPLLGVMPASALDVALEPEAFREASAIGLGGGGLVFLDESACILDLCAQYEWFIEDESCGRCTTCHGGTQRALEVVKRIQRGGGRESDLGKLKLLGDTLRYSNCFHGQFALSIITNALQWFSDEINEHIFEHRCRSKTCKGLIRYEIDASSSVQQASAGDLAKALDYCPTGAVKLVDGSYIIEDALCVRCDACHVLAPGAVRVVDYFEAAAGPAPELISVQPAER